MNPRYSLRAVNAAGKVLFENKINLDQSVIIGRGPASNVQIVDAVISGAHVEMQLTGTQFTVKDLQSQNGTFFAGRQVDHFSATAPFNFSLSPSVTVEITLASPDAEHLGARLYNQAAAVNTRMICLGILSTSLVYAVALMTMRQEGLFYALGYSLTTFLVVAGMIAAVAAFWAFIGYLVRGTYRPRPVFVSSMVATTFSLFCTLLMPLAFVSVVGLPFKLLVLGLSALIGAATAYINFSAVLPVRWTKALTVIACLSGTANGFSRWEKSIHPDRQAFMQTVFEEDAPTSVYLLERKVVDTNQLAADFQNLERDLSRKPASLRK